MAYLILAILVAVLALVGAQFIKTTEETKQEMFRMARYGVQIAGILLFLLLVASTSFVFVGADETGHRVKIYLGDDLQKGAIIATGGEKGPQAQIMPPGFHMEPLLNIIYDVTMKSVVDIKEGEYGFLVARDGQPLRPDQTYADPFAPGENNDMISDAAYFLNHAGQKGPQASVLTPGRYRLNRFLWEVKASPVTDIPKGFVGVIRSNVHSRVDFSNLKNDKPKDCSPVRARDTGGAGLAVPLVPVGCIGVWEHALNPGKYYINRQAYKVELVDTRVQAWEYKGGHLRRAIDLKVNREGDITQTERSEKIAVPKTAVARAIFIKVEGWDVPLELRALVQVTPKNAAFVIASVGGLKQVEQRILTPAIRSVLRNVVGGTIRVPTAVKDKDGNPILDDSGHPILKAITRPTRVLDLIENRDVLEQNVERLIRPEGDKAGVDIKEVRFGDPVIPPEILVARQREQLAQQLKRAFSQERAAQSERIATEQARATADQQQRLVEAQIQVKRSEQLAVALRNEGLGERDKLNLIAEGQKAQAQVLGEDRVVELRRFELVVNSLLTFFKDHPDVLTTALANAHKFVPERVITIGGEGGGNNLAGAAAVLGDFVGGGRATAREAKEAPSQKEK